MYILTYLFDLSKGIPIFLGATLYLLKIIIATNVIAKGIIFATSQSRFAEIVN